MTLPLNTGACEWVERNIGRELVDLERELVTILCAAFDTGPWNVAKWRLMRRSGYRASLSVRSDLSTFDSDRLTRLVFAAHDRCCRVEVGTSNPWLVRVSVSRREGREGSVMTRHPSIESAVESWRKQYPPEAT